MFSEDGAEHVVVSEDHSSFGLGCIERHLKVTHADLMATLQSKFKDDPEFPCCCCERKQVSCVNFSLEKYNTKAWLTLKSHIVLNSDAEKGVRVPLLWTFS